MHYGIVWKHCFSLWHVYLLSWKSIADWLQMTALETFIYKALKIKFHNKGWTRFIFILILTNFIKPSPSHHSHLHCPVSSSMWYYFGGGYQRQVRWNLLTGSCPFHFTPWHNNHGSELTWIWVKHDSRPFLNTPFSYSLWSLGFSRRCQLERSIL
jgi:hypothetical protein